jgi:hypothetical protein
MANVRRASGYIWAGIGTALLTLVTAAAEPQGPPASSTLIAYTESPPQMSPAQSHYLKGCGGCHGIQGTSSKQDIPQLRGLVGQYLCTPAGRAYLVRLPNVAFADMDDALLADVMNFVVFRLGEGSAPAYARAYSPREVADLRHRPLKNERLAQLRATVLADAIKQCERHKQTAATR